MKKKQIIIISVAAVTALLFAAVFIFKGNVFNGNNNSPSSFLDKAVGKSISACTVRDQNLKMPNASLLKQSPYEFVLNVGLRGYSLSMLPKEYEFTAETLTLLTFASKSRVDTKNRRISNDIGVYLAGGVNYFNANLYIDDDIYALTAPQLTGYPLYISLNSFISDWNDSLFLSNREFWNEAPFFSELGINGRNLDESFSFKPYNDLFFADKTLMKPAEDSDAELFINTLADFLLKGCETASYLNEEDDYAYDGDYTIIISEYSEEAIRDLYTFLINMITNFAENRIEDILAFLVDFEGATDMTNEILSIVPEFSFNGDCQIVFLIDNDDLIKGIHIYEKGMLSDNNSPFIKIDIDNQSSSDSGKYGDYVNIILQNPLIGEIAIECNTTGCTEDSIDYVTTLTSTTDTNTYKLSFNALWLPEKNNDYCFSLALESGESRVSVSTDGKMTANDDEITIKDAITRLTYNDEYVELKTAWQLKSNAEPPVFDINDARNAFDVNIVEWGAIGVNAWELLTF